MTDGRKLGLIREMMIKLYGTLPLKRVMLRLLITMDVGRYYYGAEAFSDSAREIFRKYYYVNYSYGTYGLMPNPGHFAGRKNAVITIGRYCSIAPGALRYNTNHPMDWKQCHDSEGMYKNRKRSCNWKRQRCHQEYSAL